MKIILFQDPGVYQITECLFTINKDNSHFLVKVKPPVESIVAQYKQRKENQQSLISFKDFSYEQNSTNLPDIMIYK